MINSESSTESGSIGRLKASSKYSWVGTLGAFGAGVTDTTSGNSSTIMVKFGVWVKAR